MALSIPSYPNPKNKLVPLTDAYSFISGIGLETKGTGRATFDAYVSLAAMQAGSELVDQINVALGQVLVPEVKAEPNAVPPVAGSPAVTFRTLPEFMADETPVGNTGITFAQAYGVIGLAIQLEAVAKHPLLKDATIA